MERNTLRIRLVSFKDTAKRNLESLFYIKKLTQLPSANGKIKTFNIFFKKNVKTDKSPISKPSK